MKNNLLNAILNLLKVKSIITLITFSAFFYLSIIGKIDTDNFMLILGMISTYFFTKKSNGDDHNEWRNIIRKI